MKFGAVATGDAEGAILAHSIRLETGLFKKGRVINADDVALLLGAGIRQITVAQLGPEDTSEDVAARAVAVAISGAGSLAQEAFTGRANIYSQEAGLVQIDVARIDALNNLHESLTLATLCDGESVKPRQMIATVKVIPFAVPRAVLDNALALINHEPLVSLRAFLPLKVALIITALPHTKPGLIEKSKSSIAERLSALGAELVYTAVCAHTIEAVQNAIHLSATVTHDICLLAGASAIVDRLDVIPAGLVSAGGRVVHLGMPVDPGNLLMLGALNNKPVVGVPSCARSPKTNGFDWVLQRLMTGEKLTSKHIMAMGVGGLLGEIATRPSPREKKHAVPSAPQISAVVLAAGKSTRMGSNKLLALVGGVALVRRTVLQIIASRITDIVVVTGHEHELLEKALEGLSVRFMYNDQYADGLSGSLRVGIEALPDTADAALVCLGDMPLVKPQDINRMIAAFNPAEQRHVVVPRHEDAWGNPILWGRDYFDGLTKLTGDRGARTLLDELADELVEVTVDDIGVKLDADTPDALELVRSIQAGES